MTFMTMHHIIYFGGQFGGLIRHWYQSRGQLSIEEIGGFDLSHWSPIGLVFATYTCRPPPWSIIIWSAGQHKIRPFTQGTHILRLQPIMGTHIFGGHTQKVSRHTHFADGTHIRAHTFLLSHRYFTQWFCGLEWLPKKARAGYPKVEVLLYEQDTQVEVLL